jgi:hypothetical protein
MVDLQNHHLRQSFARPQSLGWLVIGRAARDSELPVEVVDDHTTPRSNSKLLGQPRPNDYLQELAVDLADPLGKWRQNSPTCVKWDEDRELAIDDFDGRLE